jgi:hypothetical protein
MDAESDDDLYIICGDLNTNGSKVNIKGQRYKELVKNNVITISR